MAKLATARGSLDRSELLRGKSGTMIDRITLAICGDVCCHVQRVACARRLDDE